MVFQLTDLVYFFLVFVHLSSNNVIVILGGIEEFVIIVVEFLFIVNDSVALILDLRKFTICVFRSSFIQ